MPGDGGVCGVTVEVLLDVVDFAGVEAGVMLAVVLAGAAGAGAGVEGAEVFVELVAAGMLDPVVEVADLLALDFDDLLLVVVLPEELVVAGVVDPAVVEVPLVVLVDFDFFLLLLVVEVLDEVEVLEDPAGACDLISVEETRPMNSASNTEGTALLLKGKDILSLLSTRSAQAVVVRYRHLTCMRRFRCGLIPGPHSRCRARGLSRGEKAVGEERRDAVVQSPLSGAGKRPAVSDLRAA